MPNSISLSRLAFHHGLYAEVRHKGSDEELAKLFKDMIDSMLEDREPEIPLNQRNLAKSHILCSNYLEKKKKKSAEMKELWKKTKAENKALKEKHGENLFDTEKSARPSREEVDSEITSMCK
jgi:hypothetical protein